MSRPGEPRVPAGREFAANLFGFFSQTEAGLPAQVKENKNQGAGKF